MALIPRIVLGKNDDGETVIQASPTGVDVLEIEDEGEFTFNSNWPQTGIIHEVGFKSGFDTDLGNIGWGVNTWGSAILFNELPYRPQVIVGRVTETAIIWDELTVVGASQYLYTPYRLDNVFLDGFIMYGEPDRIPTPHNFIYVVFKTPIPGIPTA